MEILIWLLNLSITDIILAIAGIIVFLLFFIHCYASFSNETFLENFDNHTLGYLVFAGITIFLLLSLLLFKIVPEIFIFLVFILPALGMFSRSRRNRYYDNGNNQNPFSRNIFTMYFQKRQKRINRRISLQAAKDFLRPYKNLFGNHTLSNKFCNVTYKPDKKFPKFICINNNKNKEGKYEFFEVLNPEKPETFDLFFNSLCINFDYHINFHTLHKIFNTTEFRIHYINCTENDFKHREEAIRQNSYPYNVLDKIKDKEKQIIQNIKKEKSEQKYRKLKEINKININEASEAEITSLPGINIIQAKKIIKYRNVNGDFKSVDDFLNYIKVKPHFEEQVKNMVTTIPQTLKINFNKSADERIIDLD